MPVRHQMKWHIDISLSVGCLWTGSDKYPMFIRAILLAIQYAQLFIGENSRREIYNLISGKIEPLLDTWALPLHTYLFLHICYYFTLSIVSFVG